MSHHDESAGMKPSYEGHDEWPSIPPATFHAIRDIDGKHCDGHNRLRVDFDQMAERMTLMQRSIDEHDTALMNVAKRTTDVSQLRFTPQVVVAIVAVCVSIVGGQYLSTIGIRDEQARTNAAVSTVNLKMDALKQHNEDATRLLDERSASMTEAIKEIKARAEMTDIKVNNLRETVLTNRR